MRFLTIIFFIVVIFLNCGQPDKKKVVESFLQENPGTKVLSVKSGEGDADSIYFHIKYRKPEGQNVYEDVWLYLRNKNGEWFLNHKE